MNVVSDGKQLLRLATAGSVDDGKSTLIGRMLYDAKLLFDDTIDALHRNGANGVPDLAALTDGLRAEREQGITIDVAYRYFTTPRRSFIIADTPGHQRYTRNMVTGASTAQLAVILIDARHGIIEQSRRHATLSSLLGIRHLVAAVNKMDLVDWDEARFREIEQEFAGLATRLGVEDARAFPISALHGDNVVDKGEADWYDGPPLLQHLETIDVAADRGAGPFRLPVQWVIRPEESARRERRYAGQVAGGSLRVGDEVVVMPSGATTTVIGVETFDGPVESGRAARLRLDPDRGRPRRRPRRDDLRHGRPADRGPPPRGHGLLDVGAAAARRRARRAQAHDAHGARRGRVDRLAARRRDAGGDQAAGPARAQRHRPGHAPHERARGRRPLRRQPHDGRVHPRRRGLQRHRRRRHGPRGPRDAAEGAAALAGRHLARDGAAPRASAGRRCARAARRSGSPACPSSGKSSIAAALERSLVVDGHAAYFLDGDNLRHGISGDLAFSPADRTENIRRVAHVARLMADAGMVAIASLVSPTRHDRALARELHQAAGLKFLEVYVNTPLEVAEARDPKGLYARARAGKLLDFTGVSAPYEAPEQPDVLIHGAEEDAAAAAARIREALEQAWAWSS